MKKINATMQVTKACAQILAQDYGRKGGQHIGVTESGASDRYAFTWANKLLHNPANTPALEITLGPFVAEFSHAVDIALCGADMQATVNGTAIQNWSTFHIKPGDKLTLGYAKTGLRTYLAITGGFKFNGEIYSSIASVTREHLGFNQGRPISAAMKLSYTPNTKKLPRTLQTPWRYIPDYNEELELNIYPCYQHEYFSDDEKQRLTSTHYTIDPASNRMGYRVKGEKIGCNKTTIISEGIAYGAIQIPPDGQPIILLNDRQTIGGYPKIGCIARQDCYQLSQRRPGQLVRFNWSLFND